MRAYIDLFQLKSENPLSIRFEVEGDLQNGEIEPLLLLPLVENALKHGDLEEHPAGYLHFLLRKETKGLFFRVENSFNPADEQKDEVCGVGLDNIRQRLELNYPGRYRLEIRQEEGRFVSVLEIDGAQV